MRDIPTLDNPGFGTTASSVQVLAANDIVISYDDPDIYLRPSPNINNKYLSPTGDLYKRPGSP